MLKSGENREAGENPARSRHCEEGKSKKVKVKVRKAFNLLHFCLLPFAFLLSKPGDLPIHICNLLSASRQGVQAARAGLLLPIKFPSLACKPSREGAQESDGIFV